MTKMSTAPSTSSSHARAGRMRLGPAETKVFVVADDASVRAATRALLSDEPGLRLVGECGAVEAAGAVARSAPHVVVVHHDPRGTPANRGVGSILVAAANVRVLVVTPQRDPAALLETLAAGASGYLLDEGASVRLAHAVHAVMDGRVPIDPALVTLTRERLARLEELERQDRRERSRIASAPAPATAANHSLTARELTVLGHVAAGLTNELIAAQLVLSPGTVKLHVQHIIAKLGVANRTQAAVYAAQHGLLESP